MTLTADCQASHAQETPATKILIVGDLDTMEIAEVLLCDFCAAEITRNISRVTWQTENHVYRVDDYMISDIRNISGVTTRTENHVYPVDEHMISDL